MSKSSGFSQGQDWESAGWGSRAPPRGAAKQQALNSARRAGTVVTEAKCTWILALSHFILLCG